MSCSHGSDAAAAPEQVAVCEVSSRIKQVLKENESSLVFFMCCVLHYVYYLYIVMKMNFCNHVVFISLYQYLEEKKKES